MIVACLIVILFAWRSGSSRYQCGAISIVLFIAGVADLWTGETSGRAGVFTYSRKVNPAAYWTFVVIKMTGAIVLAVLTLALPLS